MKNISGILLYTKLDCKNKTKQKIKKWENKNVLYQSFF